MSLLAFAAVGRAEPGVELGKGGEGWGEVGKVGEVVKVGEDATVVTREGPVVGRETAQGAVFLGIPYAEAPVGARRWRAPERHGSWTAPRSARQAAAVCPQPADPFAVVGPVDRLAVVGDEDCLYLNVYRPAGAVRAPVLLWIHGGGYLTGAGSEADASVFAQRQGVVVVTINYRLGALGFLAHQSLSSEVGGEGSVGSAGSSGSSGNYGLQDQQLAMRWVQDNIDAFGGDHTRVTLGGQSAGAISICDHLASPTAAGLFQGAILQSGSCVGRLLMAPRPLAEAMGERLARTLGCEEHAASPSCLRGISAAEIVRRSSSVAAGYGWSAVYGDAILPQRPDAAFRAGAFNRVPMISGSTRDEARAFVLMYALSKVPFTAATYRQWALASYGPESGERILAAYPPAAYGAVMAAYAAASTDATFSCRAKWLNDALASRVPVYAYEFADESAVTRFPVSAEVPPLGAFHSSDLVYIFQTRGLVAEPELLQPGQKALADQMMDFWGRFVRTGQPNGQIAEWPRYGGADRDILRFTPGELQRSAAYSAEHRCDFWQPIDG